MSSPFIKRVQIKNIFSFDEEGIDLEMKPLNVLIGPNAVGKSNFISALEIMFSLPWSFRKHIKEIGGIEDTLWKNAKYPEGEICLTLEVLKRLVHTFKFDILQEITEESILPFNIKNRFTPLYFENKDNKPRIAMKNRRGGKRDIIELDIPDDFKDNESILSQSREKRIYPELTFLKDQYFDIINYGIFKFVDFESLKKSNKANDENLALYSDDTNFSLVINKLDDKGLLSEKIFPILKNLYDIDDIRTSIEDGVVKLKIHEKQLKKPIPLSRISDGTLRFLRILSIIFNPNAPKVICLEEPENGLHPEVIPALADALIEASEDRQIIVTTHSPELIDALTNIPESIIICEREDAGTKMKRLDGKDLDNWLKRYCLGQLWQKGVLGGTRY